MDLRDMDPKSNKYYQTNKIPVAIRLFLWRQINSCLIQKSKKLKEASITTWQRVMVQNLLDDLSPVLSTAIREIPRWSFIKTSFPYMVQCAALILKHRKVFYDDLSSSPNISQGQECIELTQDEIKLFYIMNWLLLDAFNESVDVLEYLKQFKKHETEGFDITDTLYNFEDIKMFVMLFCPLFRNIARYDLTNIRLENGLRIWYPLEDYGLPKIYTLAIPAKPCVEKTLHALSEEYLKGTFVESDSQGNDEHYKKKGINTLIDIDSIDDISSASSTHSESSEPLSPRRLPRIVTRLNMDQEKVGYPSFVNFVSQPQTTKTTGRESVATLTPNSPPVPNRSRSPSMRDEKVCAKHLPITSISRLKSIAAPIIDMTDICGSMTSSQTSSSATTDSLCSKKQQPLTIKRQGDEKRPVISFGSGIGKITRSNLAETAFTFPVPDSSRRDDTLKYDQAKSTKNAEKEKIHREQFLIESTKYSISSSPRASLFDVAVIQCLLGSQWFEEGILWSLHYLLHRINQIHRYLRQTNLSELISTSNNYTSMPGTSILYDLMRRKTLSLPDMSDLDKLTDINHLFSECQEYTSTPQNQLSAADALDGRKQRLLSRPDNEFLTDFKIGSISRSHSNINLASSETVECGQAYASQQNEHQPIKKDEAIDTLSTNMLQDTFFRRKSLPHIVTSGAESLNTRESFIGGTTTKDSTLKDTDKKTGLSKLNIFSGFSHVGNLVGKTNGLLKNTNKNSLNHRDYEDEERSRKSVSLIKGPQTNLSIGNVELNRIHHPSSLDEEDVDVLSLKHPFSARDNHVDNTRRRIASDSHIKYQRFKYIEIGGCINYITEAGFLDFKMVLLAMYRSLSMDPAFSNYYNNINVSYTKDSNIHQIAKIVSTCTLTVIKKFSLISCSPSTSNNENVNPKILGFKSDGLLKNINSLKLYEIIKIVNLDLKDDFEYFMVMDIAIKSIKIGGCYRNCAYENNVKMAQDIIRINKNIIRKMYQLHKLKFEYYFKRYALYESAAEQIEFYHVLYGFCQDAMDTNNKKEPSQISSKSIEVIILKFIIKNFLYKLGKIATYLMAPENFNLFNDVIKFVNFIKIRYKTLFDQQVIFKGSEGQTRKIVRKLLNLNTIPILQLNDIRKDSFIRASSFDDFPERRLSGDDVIVNLNEPQTNDSKFSKMKKLMEKLKGKQQKERSKTIESLIRASELQKLTAIHHFATAQNTKKSASTTRSSHFRDCKGDQDIRGSMPSKIKNYLMPEKYRSKYNLLADLKDTDYEKLDVPLINAIHIDQDVEKLASYLDKFIEIDTLKRSILRIHNLFQCIHIGSFPEPEVITSVLDMKAPILSRASFIIECSYYVNMCNHGRVMSCFKNESLNIFSPVALSRKNAKRINQTKILLGNLFYKWGEMISDKIEELLNNECEEEIKMSNSKSNENTGKCLNVEDFFIKHESDLDKEKTYNTLLKYLMANLLYEVTVFLKNLKKKAVSSQKNLNKKLGVSWDKRKRSRWNSLLGLMGVSISSLSSVGPDEVRKSLLATNLSKDESSHGSVISMPHADDDLIVPSDATKRISEAFINEGRARERFGSTFAAITGQKSKRPSLKLKNKDNSRRESAVLKHRKVSLEQSPTSSTPTREDIDASNVSTITNHHRTTNIHSNEMGSTTIPSSTTISILSPGQTKPNAENQAKPGHNNLQSQQFQQQQQHHQSVIYPHKNLGDPVRPLYASLAILGDDKMKEFGKGDSSTTHQLSTLPDEELDQIDLNVPENYPWITTCVGLQSLVDYQCTHIPCNPACYNLLYHNVRQLVKALSLVYQYNLKRDSCSSNLHALNTLNYLMKKKCLSNVIMLVDIPKSNVKKFQLPLDRLPAKINVTIPYYNFNQVKDCSHTVFMMMIKVIHNVPEYLFQIGVEYAWSLLQHSKKYLAYSTAALTILGSIKFADFVTAFITKELDSTDEDELVVGINKYFRLWKFRNFVWPQIYDEASSLFKVTPPNIEFTLPSPMLGISFPELHCAPWNLIMRSTIEDLTLSQDVSAVMITTAKSRKKQKEEYIYKLRHSQSDKMKLDRENYLLSSVSYLQQASFDPLINRSFIEHEEDNQDKYDMITTFNCRISNTIFPSSLSIIFVKILVLLYDENSLINMTSIKVKEICHSIIWTCMIEDPLYFLRTIFERLTRKELPCLINWLQNLLNQYAYYPPFLAYTIFNYMLGYTMQCIRSSKYPEAQTLGCSILWQVAPFVTGITLKDFGQTLRREQCDNALSILAYNPPTKKIIIHAPDQTSIPTQLSVNEVTKFSDILYESLDFFNIPREEYDKFQLINTKTKRLHNPHAFVRDYYIFKKSVYPQLSLVKISRVDASRIIEKENLIAIMNEINRVQLVQAFLTYTSKETIQNTSYYLCEELKKNPIFLRKSLNPTCTSFGNRRLAKELMSYDMLQSYLWIKMLNTIFYKGNNLLVTMEDLQAFVPVITGIYLIYNSCFPITRISLSALINFPYNYKHIFGNYGYVMMIPTLLRIYAYGYSNNYTKVSIESIFKLFYMMHRKPFVLQVLACISELLEGNEVLDNLYAIQPKVLYDLVFTFEKSMITDINSSLELLQQHDNFACLDICYANEPETFNFIEMISLCITIICVSPESDRSLQMMVILRDVVPYYLNHLIGKTKQNNNDRKCVLEELSAYKTMYIDTQTLVRNLDPLARPFVGHLAKEHEKTRFMKRGIFDVSKIKEKFNQTTRHQYNLGRVERIQGGHLMHQYECYVKPRDTVISFLSEFLASNHARLLELINSGLVDKQNFNKSNFMFEQPSLMKFVEIVNSLLKLAPYEISLLSRNGISTFLTEVLPICDWNYDSFRPAINLIYKRLDKMINKIYRHSNLRSYYELDYLTIPLKGIIGALKSSPSIAHLQTVKSITQTCINLVLQYVLSAKSSNVMDDTSYLDENSFMSVTIYLAIEHMSLTRESFFNVPNTHIINTTTMQPQPKLDSYLFFFHVPLLLNYIKYNIESDLEENLAVHILDAVIRNACDGVFDEASTGALKSVSIQNFLNSDQKRPSVLASLRKTSLAKATNTYVPMKDTYFTNSSDETFMVDPVAMCHICLWVLKVMIVYNETLVQKYNFKIFKILTSVVALYRNSEMLRLFEEFIYSYRPNLYLTYVYIVKSHDSRRSMSLRKDQDLNGTKRRTFPTKNKIIDDLLSEHIALKKEIFENKFKKRRSTYRNVAMGVIKESPSTYSDKSQANTAQFKDQPETNEGMGVKRYGHGRKTLRMTKKRESQDPYYLNNSEVPRYQLSLDNSPKRSSTSGNNEIPKRESLRDDATENSNEISALLQERNQEQEDDVKDKNIYDVYNIKYM